MIIYVNNFEGAKAYPVMFNTSEIFLDANEDKFYCKAVDKMGKYSISTYEFHQVENPKPLTSADFVPREQFDALAAKLDTLVTILSQSSQATQQPPVAEVTPQATTTTTGRRSKGDTNDGK